MTLREAKQYESQGWAHVHDWKFDKKQQAGIYMLSFYKCRCGKIKMITPSGLEKVL